jgi:hypothetical protein
MVSALATGLPVAGSGPAEDDVFLWVTKIRSAHFHRREVKPSVQYRSFTACKRILECISEMLCRQNFSKPISHP